MYSQFMMHGQKNIKLFLIVSDATVPIAAVNRCFEFI